MKRLFLGVVVVLGMSTTVFAGNRGSRNDFNVDVNVSKLSRYLQLTSDQTEEVANISEYFAEKVQGASYAREEKQAQKLRDAVYGNFKLMKRTLNEEQYRKYVHLVNVTLKNKGLDTRMEYVASK
ncbi:MAG: hypothetical protein ACRCUJ_04360 [Phocaeicola sp.]